MILPERLPFWRLFGVRCAWCGRRIYKWAYVERYHSRAEYRCVDDEDCRARYYRGIRESGEIGVEFIARALREERNARARRGEGVK